jgi:formiminotetrahydrofolate cyclodeaminase
MDDALAGRPVEALIDRVSSAGAGFGGGVLAAVTTALAAAVVTVVARGSQRGWEDAAGVAAQAAALRERTTELAYANASTFAAARQALSEREEDGIGRKPLQPLLHGAAAVPFHIGSAAADLAELAAETARHGDPGRRADVAAAAAMAEAAVRAAVTLIEVNLAVDRDDDIATQMRHDLAAAAEARAEAEALVD